MSRPYAPRQSPLNWLPTLVVNVGLPIVSYVLLSNRGLGAVPALALSAVWPLAELLVTVIRQRHLDEFSAMALVVLALGIVTSFLFSSPRLVLVKESAFTGLFGLTLLASVLFGRPLMFYFGRRFATDGSPEGVAWWNGLWQYPEFRRSQQILTLAWGAAFVTEAVVRAALTYVLPTTAMVVINNVLPYMVLAGLVFGTFSYGRRKAGAHGRTAPLRDEGT